MELQPIPITELQIGEFYDVQITDKPQSVCGALLLKKCPPNQATLLFLHVSKSNPKFNVQSIKFVLRKSSLQLETIQLETVYPYLTFTRLPDKVLRWPENYSGEAVISQISEEMHRVVREGHWGFNLPHFCEGYLHIYFSYLWHSAECPKRWELFDFWFEFANSFFSVLRDHILHSNSLSEASLLIFASAMESMSRLTKCSYHSRAKNVIPLSQEKETSLIKLEMSVIEACRPRELSGKQFDSLWQCLIQENPMDLVVWQLQEPLTLRKLLLDSTKLIGILNNRADCFQELSEANFPGLRPEEILRVRLRVAILDIKKFGIFSLKSWTEPISKLVKALLEDYEQIPLSLEELILIVSEEKLIDTVIESGSKELVEYVLTRTAVFPLVFAYLKRKPEGMIRLNSLLACVSARIALEDWSFITWASTNKFLQSEFRSTHVHSMKTYQRIRAILGVVLEGKMSVELFRNLLPNEIFGHIVFQAFLEGFTLNRSRQIMLTYFGSEQRCFEVAREIALSYPEGAPNCGKKKAYVYMKEADLWYMLRGSVHIQLLWVRQFIFIKRLSIALTREVCSYLA